MTRCCRRQATGASRRTRAEGPKTPAALGLEPACLPHPRASPYSPSPRPRHANDSAPREQRDGSCSSSSRERSARLPQPAKQCSPHRLMDVELLHPRAHCRAGGSRRRASAAGLGCRPVGGRLWLTPGSPTRRRSRTPRGLGRLRGGAMHAGQRLGGCTSPAARRLTHRTG